MLHFHYWIKFISFITTYQIVQEGDIVLTKVAVIRILILGLNLTNMYIIKMINPLNTTISVFLNTKIYPFKQIYCDIVA